MERTGVTPPGAVVAPDLAEVLATTGPFITVYMTTEADVENAGQRSEQRWRSIRRELADRGAPEAALDQIEALVPDAHQHGPTLAVIANADGVLHVEHGPEPPPRDRFEVGPVPPLVPIIAIRQNWPTFVTVRADRLGADIQVCRHARPDLEREVEGDEYPVRRVSAGGWSQLRYQHRAENTWEQNAENVVEALARLSDRYKPRLIVAAGDVRALQLIGEALPEQLAPSFVAVEGGRGQDGSEDVFQERVQEQLTAHVNADTVQFLEKFREELGQGHRAADGPDETLAALAQAQVDVLLVAESPDDQRTALCGPQPTQVAREKSALHAMGVEDPVEAPLVDVAVRAALGTGAGVRLVPDADQPTGRIGAILRWS